MNQNDMTLVVGGTGKTGRRVVERLQHLGLPFRIGSRAARPAFDWEDRTTWLPSLDGVAKAYVTYYPDLAVPGALETVQSFFGHTVDPESGSWFSYLGEAKSRPSRQSKR